MTFIAAWLYLSALAMLLRLWVDVEEGKWCMLALSIFWPITTPVMLGGEFINRLIHPKETAS